MTRRPDYVWNYPRPPRLEREERRLTVVFAGQVVAETRAGLCVLETSQPPAYYFPPAEVRTKLLAPSAVRSLCEFKGTAVYWDLRAEGAVSRSAAWSYPDPTPRYRALAGYFAFYPARVAACFIDGEPIRAQPGAFYGGWVSADLRGPIKGAPGSEAW